MTRSINRWDFVWCAVVGFSLALMGVDFDSVRTWIGMFLIALISGYCERKNS